MAVTSWGSPGGADQRYTTDWTTLLSQLGRPGPRRRVSLARRRLGLFPRGCENGIGSEGRCRPQRGLERRKPASAEARARSERDSSIGSRRRRLTVAGELLLRHITATLHDFDRVRAEIDDLKSARSGHVSISAMDSLWSTSCLRAIDRFRAEFPAVSYTVVSTQPTDVPQHVADGSADLGFTFVSQVPPSVRFEAKSRRPSGW